MKKIFHLSSRIILLLLIISTSGFYIYACLWAAGRNQVGKRIQIDGVAAPEFVRNLITHEDRNYWEKARAELKNQRKFYPFFENRNNLAVALIHLGKIKEAIPLLEEIEKNRRDQYITAANLGTAYELNGENQKALEWIKEGIKRNKESHYGTEWLHVKILEAKLAMEKDPNWLKTHSVLGADFTAVENSQEPKKLATDHLGQQRSLAETEEALIYQLHERLEFVKPPDPIVADLLFDLSHIFSLRRTDEHAKAVYDLAVTYDSNHEKFVKGRLDNENRVKPASPSTNYLFYIGLGITVLVLMIGFYVFIKRRRLR